MSSSSRPKPDFVPAASIVAFVCIGVVFLVVLIARCLALNHSTIGNTQNLDLMIYKAAPRAIPPPKAKRESTEQPFDSTNDTRDQRTSYDDPVTPTRVQRGPKNL